MTAEPRTYVYLLRGSRAGQYGYMRGTFADREVTAVRGAIEKALVRFRDGKIKAVEIANLREATVMENVIERRYGEF